jgi:Domain of unknown function (DUF4383)
MAIDRPTPIDDRRETYDVSERRASATTMTWSPAQIVGLIIGIGYTAVGITAVVDTGFNTDHLDTPHHVGWQLAHSPLLGAIEIAFGVLVIVASLVPGGARVALRFLGAIALVFGIVVLAESIPNRLNDWLAVTHRNGWVYLISGAVVLLVALFSPSFGGEQHRVVREDERLVDDTP